MATITQAMTAIVPRLIAGPTPTAWGAASVSAAPSRGDSLVAIAEAPASEASTGGAGIEGASMRSTGGFGGAAISGSEGATCTLFGATRRLHLFASWPPRLRLLLLRPCFRFSSRMLSPLS
jgi:hypothetical protein